MSLSFLLEKIHTVNDFIALWGEDFPLLKELKTTIQDKEWHGEGDVHIHTDLVLYEVYNIINDKLCNLCEDDKIALILGAIFHDICKPLTTKEKELNGIIRVVAPKHEEYGRNYLFYKLNKIIKNKKIFNNVLGIVGFHQTPKMLVIRNQPKGKFFQLARRVPLKLIYLLEIADIKGRTCPDKENQIDYLELFKIYAQEYNLWDANNVYKDEKAFIDSELTDFSDLTKQYVFSEYCRQFEKGAIVCPEEEIARSYQYRNGFPHLIVNCGVSGVGKSTYIEDNYKEYNVISLDGLREELLGSRSDHSHERKVLDEAKARLKVLLAKKEKIIWDATSYRSDFRKVPLGLGFNYRAFTEISLFNKTRKDILAQNKQRDTDVTEKIIDIQMKKFEVPHIEECHNIKEIYGF